VAGLLREHLTELLRGLGDPRLADAVITAVELADDLSFARIRVRPLIDSDDPKRQKALLTALLRASPRLRRALGPRLELKKLPVLRFEYDAGADNARRVEELLREIADEHSDD
jgi:ribosome-binding factor A